MHRELMNARHQGCALRFALEVVKADTALHAGAGPTFALVCATLEANPLTP